MIALVDYVEPTVVAAPLFLAAVAIEAVVLRRWRRRERPAPGEATGGRRRTVIGYSNPDTWTSLSMGVASLVTVGLINLGVYLIAQFWWQYRLWDLGTGVAGWVVAMLGWDFLYYWYHRWEHEIRLFWANHVTHHSSLAYNYSTALRQPLTPYPYLVLLPLLALVGVAPWMIMVAGGFNLIYQFWVHTEMVGRMPRWFEFVFNTPSHHRVHHGSDPEYLDKNYGGILILFDRVFGTFQAERQQVTYGLTKNIGTYNPWRVGFGEYGAWGHDLRRARTWRERLGYTFGRPGWEPGTADLAAAPAATVGTTPDRVGAGAPRT